MPAKLQPDLENLQTMQEVWSTLDEEFGQMMENVSGQVLRLLAFQYSKEAKGETSKFMELWRLWNEVCADLRELGKLGVLNHGRMESNPTLLPLNQPNLLAELVTSSTSSP